MLLESAVAFVEPNFATRTANSGVCLYKDTGFFIVARSRIRKSHSLRAVFQIKIDIDTRDSPDKKCQKIINIDLDLRVLHKSRLSSS